MISKSSIRKAIAQARGCEQGDLYLDADGKTVCFTVGMSDSFDYGSTYPDFWYLAKEHSFEKVVGDNTQMGSFEVKGMRSPAGIA